MGVCVFFDVALRPLCPQICRTQFLRGAIIRMGCACIPRPSWFPPALNSTKLKKKKKNHSDKVAVGVAGGVVSLLPVVRCVDNVSFAAEVGGFFLVDW